MPDHRIAVLAFPGVQPLDAVGPFEAFAAAAQVLDGLGRGGSRPRPTLVAPTGGIVRGESGLALHADASIAALDPRSIDTLVVAGGDGVYEIRHDPSVLAWVRATARHARRVASVCSGAFVLAEAGLLDGRRATTHWARARRLAAEYPDVAVDADAIVVRDGSVWTSAGVTAGIDLALALVADDHGVDVAETAARWLVMFLHRPGGQAQFARPPARPRAEREPIREAQDLVHAEPHADLSVGALARHVGLSERTFLRQFHREVGTTPARYVESVRVDAARALLETSTAGVEHVAYRCGFGTAETMRRAFVRTLGVSPTDYRARFRREPAPQEEIA